MSRGLSDQYFLAGNRRFASEMKDLGFDFGYEEWEGGHNRSFFGTALEKALRWAATA